MCLTDTFMVVAPGTVCYTVLVIKFYSAPTAAKEIGLTDTGFYALRRTMASKGVVPGIDTGIKTGTGTIILYTDEDVEVMRAWRKAHPVITKPRKPPQKIPLWRMDENGNIVAA